MGDPAANCVFNVLHTLVSMHLFTWIPSQAENDKRRRAENDKKRKLSSLTSPCSYYTLLPGKMSMKLEFHIKKSIMRQ